MTTQTAHLDPASIAGALAARIPGASPANVTVTITENDPAGGTHTWTGSADGLAAALKDALFSTPQRDTLPAWLYQRFARDRNVPWDDLHEDNRSYWEHEAAAVRRAVARGGFKSSAKVSA
jgi:hypothetical protein